MVFPVATSESNPMEHLWDVEELEICCMKVHLKNRQELHDAITSAWTWMSSECFQRLVESLPRKILTFTLSHHPVHGLSVRLLFNTTTLLNADSISTAAALIVVVPAAAFLAFIFNSVSLEKKKNKYECNLSIC